MNVVVMQVSGKKAVVLERTGAFVTIPAQKGMKPGCEFAYEKPSAQHKYRVITAIAASVVLLLMSVAGFAAMSISTCVDVNINPGVRMYLNTFGMVVKTEAINGDGRRLLSGLSVPWFSRIESNLSALITRASQNGTLKTAGGVLITISDDDASRLAAREKSLFSSSLECLRKNNINAKIITQKLSRKAFDAVLQQQNAGDGSNLHALYTSKSWHDSGNPLYIELAEALNGDTIKVVFSRDVVFTGGETVVLSDGKGGAIGCRVKSHGSDEWIITCSEMKRNQGYTLTISGIGQSAGISASLWVAGDADGGDAADHTGGNPSGSDRPDAGSPAPQATPAANEEGTKPEEDNNTSTEQATPAPASTCKPKATNAHSDGEHGNNDGNGGNEDDNRGGNDRDNQDDREGYSIPKPKATATASTSSGGSGHSDDEDNGDGGDDSGDNRNND